MPVFTQFQRPVFFAIRIALGVVSVFCEARLYRAVVEKVNERVGRYLLFLLLTGAGMWNAATGMYLSSLL
jgi:alpha-1,2-mannosyltransferase